ncbi:MAG: FG-GAP-like repeat-containing protein [Bacteroidota bacterium]
MNGFKMSGYRVNKTFKIELLLALSLTNCLVTFLLKGQNFTEVSALMGIEETYGFDTFGGGISMADFTGDGLDDISICTGGGEELAFYMNMGNGTFAPYPSPVVNTEAVKEINWIDYDNDFDMDLFFTVNGGVNRLIRNDFGSFQDVTNQAFGTNLPSFSSWGCDWGDYDKDGDLDLYVCNRQITGQPDRLWRNNGNGTFTDVASTVIQGNINSLNFDAIFTDLNSDGWPDIYLAVDRDQFSNISFINQGDGTFIEDDTNGANVSIDAMNVGGADYDNDGDYDLYVSNTQSGNALLQNNGTGQFSNVTGSTGTGVYRYCWSATFFDLDNDTDQDLYVSASNNPGFNGTNACLINIGGGVYFEPYGATGGLGGIDNKNTFSHAVGDVDNDGRLDIVSSQMAPDSIMVWKNQEPGSSKYLKVILNGIQSNTSGIGSNVRAYLPDGTSMTRFVECSNGYLSQHSRMIHFGLGSTSIIDSLIVEWPSGIKDKIESITNLNQILNIAEGDFALPLNLIDFNVEQTTEGGISSQLPARKLTWQTEWEQNTSHFEIERSTDGVVFENIGTVRALRNSNLLNDYDFLDQEHLVGSNHCYYRLKMLDLDQSYAYSPVRHFSIANNETNSIFTIDQLISNPIINWHLDLLIRRNRPGEIQYRITDTQGRSLLQQSILQHAGFNELSINLDRLSAGIYWLSLESGGQIEWRKIVVP